jgi:DNA-binding NarL/FixJ family response regulator/signal transduction histidine kinase
VTNPKKNSERLENMPEEMLNELADSILELSQEEIFEEEGASGADPAEEAEYVRSVLRRPRPRAEAEERARVARELHDSAVQSLIAVELRIDVLRRQALAQSNPLTGELGRVQGLLREEVLKLRELMQQMKSLDVDAANLLRFLEDTVERFRRETGINARFVKEGEAVNIPQRVCREVARIVQEALVNVRKHSGAQQAVVTFGATDSAWRFCIEDDGRGFPFSGRFSQAELDLMERGPVVIREGARLIGGELRIESNLDRGTRLEISVPYYREGAKDDRPQPIRIVVADDHPIFRDGLRSLLEAEPGLKVIGEALDGAEAVELTRQLKPDILLLDLAMPRHPGLEALRDLSVGSGNSVRVILLTAAAEKHQIVEALQLGARGVVLKDSATQILLKSIHAVMTGEYWVGRKTVPNMVQYLHALIQASGKESRRKKFGLTPRELEVVSAVVVGYTNKEIAGHFKIAEDTVKHHMSNIFDKVGVSTRLELAMFAVNQSIPLGTIA